MQITNMQMLGKIYTKYRLALQCSVAVALLFLAVSSVSLLSDLGKATYRAEIAEQKLAEMRKPVPRPPMTDDGYENARALGHYMRTGNKDNIYITWEKITERLAKEKEYADAADKRTREALDGWKNQNDANAAKITALMKESYESQASMCSAIDVYLKMRPDILINQQKFNYYMLQIGIKDENLQNGMFTMYRKGTFGTDAVKK